MIVVNSKLFRVNEEYNLDKIVVKPESCGCSGGTVKNVQYYRIVVDGKIYDLHNSVATVFEKAKGADSTIQSPEQYHRTLRNTMGLYSNYDSIRSKPDVKRMLERVNNIPLVRPLNA